MSIGFKVNGVPYVPFPEEGDSIWLPPGVVHMEEKKYNGLKLIGWAIFIGATLYLIL